jgi:hypothetical protein
VLKADIPEKNAIYFEGDAQVFKKIVSIMNAIGKDMQISVQKDGVRFVIVDQGRSSVAEVKVQKGRGRNRK